MNEDLIDFLKLKRLSMEKVIFCNEQKGRYTAVVLNEQKNKLILKWNSTEENYKQHLCFLQYEILKYKEKRNKKYFINYVESGENYLLLEYIDGMTLREFLIRYAKELKKDIVSEEFKKIILQLIDIYKREYIDLSYKNYNDLNFYRSTKERIYQLGLSGPNRNFPNGVRKYVIKIILQIIYPIIKRKCYKFSQCRMNIIHNDLHLNNILIDHNLNLYIIDLENYKEDFILKDIIYSYVMITKIIENKNHIKFLEKNFYPLFKENKKNIKNIINIFQFVINLNNKF